MKIEIEFRGAMYAPEAIFYKWLRCELVHEGQLPADVAILDDTPPGALVIRAGGPPLHTLGVSSAWFDALRLIVRRAIESNDG